MDASYSPVLHLILKYLQKIIFLQEKILLNFIIYMLKVHSYIQQVDSRFMIPCLEEVVITMRSPLNAEQKMSTLESLLKYGKNLRTMVIRFLQMKSIDINVDGFFDQVCKFTHQNHKIVRIE